MTPYFGIFDRKWQIYLKEKGFLLQISIQLCEKKYNFLGNFDTQRPPFFLGGGG